MAYLEGRAIDDCLELLDLPDPLTDLLSKAEKAAGDEQKRLDTVARVRHSARLAAAVEVLFDVTDSGGELTLEQVWESIEAVVPRGSCARQSDAVADMVPPPGSDADAEMRAHLTERIAHSVTPFLEDSHRGHRGFRRRPQRRAGARGDEGPAPAAGPAVPRITAADIDLGLLTGSRRVLVMPRGGGALRPQRLGALRASRPPSTGTCAAARPTLRPRPAGATPARSRWPAREARPREGHGD